jgi:hypothetical protein
MFSNTHHGIFSKIPRTSKIQKRQAHGPVRSALLTLVDSLPPTWEPVTTKALHDLRDIAIATPVYVRPTQRNQNSAFSPAWDYPLTRTERPPGFSVLQALAGDKVAFALAARNLSCPHAAKVVALQPHVQIAIDFIVSMGADIGPWRIAQTERLQGIYDALLPLSREFRKSCPRWLDWVGGPDANPIFQCIVVDALNLPNKEWVAKMFRYGFSIVGDAPDTGLWRLKTDREFEDSAPTMSVTDLERSSTSYTRQLIKQLETSYARAKISRCIEALDIADAAWEASLDEVRLKGSAAGPFTLTAVLRHLDLAHTDVFRPVPRHAVWQDDKYRPIDNGRRSGHNNTFRCHEKVSVMEADFSAAVGQSFRNAHLARGEPCPRLGASKEDEPNAYRNVPCRERGYCVAALVQAGRRGSGKVHFFVVRGHNFGFRASVPNYCEKPTTMCIAAALLLAVPVSHFIDDFTIPESETSRGHRIADRSARWEFPGSAQAAFWAIANLFNSELSTTKSQSWRQVAPSCGVVTDFSTTHETGEVRLRIKESSREKVLTAIRVMRASRTCPVEDLPRLCGKLMYVMLLGKAGRAGLQPLREREARSQPGDEVDEHLDDCLRFLESLLAGGLPDTIVHGNHHAPNVITIFTDASWQPAPPLVHGAAFISFLVFLPQGDLLFCAEAVPQHVLLALHQLKARKQPITSLETMVLAGVYFSLDVSLFEGHDVNHFGDNTGANGAAVRGYSAAPDIAQMVGAMVLHHAHHGIRVWFEYVASASNIADNGTRPDVPGNLESLLALGGRRVSFVYPSFKDLHSW